MRDSLTVWTTLLVLSLAVAPGAVAETKAGDRPPNLILIMADDLGAKELSCYGNRDHKTPHLDELARTGVQFDTCYTAAICHPTRFEIMTGQYGSRNGVFHFAGRRGGPDPDSPEEQIVNHVSFAQVLKPKGYATALAGKWQLTGKIPTLIHECGFDEYIMWAYKHNLPEGVEHKGGYERGTKTSRYWHPSVVSNGKYVPTDPDDYGPDMYTDFAIDFARRNKDRPFLIYYPMALTHSPYYSTPTTEPSQEEKFEHSPKKFRENVEYMDELVGRIVAALDETGLRENTVVFFTGDNGTGGQGKGQTTELGARVPLIVNCPGIVKPLGLCKELVDTSDMMPTLADFAGAKVPNDRPIDGRSFAPILRGEKGETREWVFSYLGDQRVLRTKRWLLEDNSPRRPGRLYDCGTSRDGTGYKEVTDSTVPEVTAVKQRFAEILKGLPAPILPEEEPTKSKKKPTKKKSSKKAPRATRQGGQ